MAADKTGNPLTQAECSTVFISCVIHSLALRLGHRNDHTYDETSIGACRNSLSSPIFFWLILFVGSLPFFNFYEYLGSMCVQNICTNTVSEPGDMLCRMTVHFGGTAAGTPNINTDVNLMCG